MNARASVAAASSSEVPRSGLTDTNGRPRTSSVTTPNVPSGAPCAGWSRTSTGVAKWGDRSLDARRRSRTRPVRVRGSGAVRNKVTATGVARPATRASHTSPRLPRPRRRSRA